MVRSITWSLLASVLSWFYLSSEWSRHDELYLCDVPSWYHTKIILLRDIMPWHKEGCCFGPYMALLCQDPPQTNSSAMKF